MRKYLSMAFMVIFIVAGYSQNNVYKPDFAYPRDVIKISERNIKNALELNNTKLLLRSVLDLVIADSRIDPDSTEKNISLIENIRDISDNKLSKSILNLLLADLYNSVYQFNKWVYDNRIIPEVQYRENIKEWNGDAFKSKIKSLVDSVLVNESFLKETQLKDLGDVLICDKETYKIYPTVFDFAISQIIQILRSFSQDKEDHIINLYNSLIDFHKDDSPSGIYFQIEKIIYEYPNNTRGDYRILENKKIDAIKNIYYKYIGNEFSCYALQNLPALINEKDSRKWLYDNLLIALKKYPSYPMKECLKNMVSELSRKDIVIESPNIIVPGDTLKVKIKSNNINHYKITLYRIKSDTGIEINDYYKFHDENDIISVADKSIDIDGSIPFEKDTVLNIIVPEIGSYIIIPEYHGVSIEKDKTYRKIHCTDIGLGLIRYNSNTALVVNPKTGIPVEGASIWYDPDNRSSQNFKQIGFTNSSGFITLPENIKGQIVAKYGLQAYSLPVYVNPISKNSKRLTIKGFTDLGICHPGDSIGWVAILYDNNDGMKVVADNEISAILYDANFLTVDTIVTTTDSYGRAYGYFKIPEGLLTGRYRIIFNTENGEGEISFIVSDYKLPTFEIKINSINNNINKSDSLIISGTAMTYSGVPVYGAEVQVSLYSQTGWWRYQTTKHIYSCSTQVLGDGYFKIVVPGNVVKGKEKDRLILSISVTSPNGESQRIERNFSLKPNYGILASIPDNIEISNSVKFDVKIINEKGNDTILPIKLKLYPDDKNTILQKNEYIFVPDERLDLSSLDSGLYKMCFSLENNESDTIIIDKVAFYRLNDSLPPKNNSVLWIPDLNINSNQKLIYGTYSDSNILFTLWTGNEILEQFWIKSCAGIHEMAVNLPDKVESARMTVFSMNNYKSEIKEVSIIRSENKKGIIIEKETFRTKIDSNTEETWTFRIRNMRDEPIEGALIADMYNISLDKLATNHYNFQPLFKLGNIFNIRFPNLNNGFYCNLSENVDYLNCKDIKVPEFQTYGYSFFRNGIMLLRNNIKMSSRATGIVEDMIEETTDEVAVFNDGGTMDNNHRTDDVDYRPSEISLAFFKPLLSTDKDGNINITFKVPNANTTWKFMALAYTKDLLTSVLTEDIMSEKDIMISPNFPRFLRTNDNIIIPTSIYNNTGSEIIATTKIDVFNAINGKIISDTIIENHIKAKNHEVIKFNISVPEDVSFIGIKVKSSNGQFSDGEQIILPILPSVVSVLESNPFYMSPKDKVYIRNLSRTRAEEETILQFSENPIWYVVSSLPGLNKPNTNFSTDISGTLFSAFVAKKISEKYPIIREVIYRWVNSSNNDSIFTSALERNKELKNILLNATPWIENAQGETEMMQQLALSFNKKEIESLIKYTFEKLQDYQSKDGGFVWNEACAQSSEWATIQVLNVLSDINSMGLINDLPKLEDMMISAMRYLQQQTVNKYKINNADNFFDFVRLCCEIPQFHRSIDGEEIYNKTLQNIISNWKKMPPVNKAISSIILYKANYKTLSKEILKSLIQTAVYNSEKGCWWVEEPYNQLETGTAVLKAFSLILPESEIINNIVQNLIYHKLNQQWYLDYRISPTIYTIIENSNSIIEDYNGVCLSVSGKEIDSGYSLFPGELTANITRYLNGDNDNMELVRQSPSPACGSIFTKFKTKSDSVDASYTDEIKIEKQIYPIKNSVLDNKYDFKIGDKVKIILTINVAQDLNYVTIIDERAACMEPTDQLSGSIFSDGLYFYKENRDSSTNLFIEYLPKGTYQIEYDMWLNNAGDFYNGIATIQSQYRPQVTAHSSGNKIKVRE